MKKLNRDEKCWQGLTDIHGEVFSIVMPLNKDGQGPCSDDEVSWKHWEVWDQVCNCLCRCDSKEDADFIVRLINAEESS